MIIECKYYATNTTRKKKVDANRWLCYIMLSSRIDYYCFVPSREFSLLPLVSRGAHTHTAKVAKTRSFSFLCVWVFHHRRVEVVFSSLFLLLFLLF